MKIGEVVQRSGVPASTLRYYEDIGLIPAPRRVSGQRTYDTEIVRHLAFIKMAQDLGFSLQEIQQLLFGFGDDIPASARWRTLAQQKIVEIDTIIAQHQTMKQVLLEGMTCGCSDLHDCELLA